VSLAQDPLTVDQPTVDGGQVPHDARNRMQRMLFFATGVGALVFGGLLATGGGGFLTQMDQLVPVFGWATVLIAIVLPATFIVLPFVLPLRAMYALAATASIGFIVLEVLWVPAMTVDVLANDASPWLQGVTALAATITAVRWQGKWVWAYAIATGPIVAINQTLARENAVLDGILDGLGGMIFSLILMGVALAVVFAADRQDAVAARARSQASIEASRRTREREQTRINAIVHDDIMTVLLAAGRPGTPPGLADQARGALAAIVTITGGDTESRSYTAEELTAVLRSTATGIVDGVNFSFSLHGELAIPARVVAAMTEALAEAMRNSAQYAGVDGQHVDREVHVDVDDSQITVKIRDHGRGFAPRSIGPRRLGIRVSIVDRMASIDGGNGSVFSRPGAGTTVDLTWKRS